ncbi:MAG TPA: response regulator [Nitrospirota bacterium]|nr:response regulator [Nitrospirota bacterium]
MTDTTAKKRILIVDDEPAILFALRMLFKRQPLIIDECDTLEKALTMIDAGSYAAVIADLRLTGEGSEEGLAILRHIREKKTATRVVIMTGNGNAEVQQEVRNLGAAIYLEKPVGVDILFNVLEQLGVVRTDETPAAGGVNRTPSPAAPALRLHS